MCGIAGVLYRDPAHPVNPSVLKAMGDQIAHRGPDAEGFWNEPGIGLVHRRLSIIDLSGGDQPHPGVRRRIDPAGLGDSLAFGMVPGAGTIFRDLAKLPPGHVLAAGPDSLGARPGRYWQPRLEPDHRPGADEWVDAVRAKL